MTLSTSIEHLLRASCAAFLAAFLTALCACSGTTSGDNGTRTKPADDATSSSLAGSSHPSSSVGTRAVAAGPTVRLMTYNVNYGLAGDTATAEAIRDGGADIVLLQETNEVWEAQLRATLSERYPHQDYRHCCLAGGLAVLSTMPFEPKEVTHPAGAWFPSWRIVADSPIGRLQLLNVHLRPNVSDSGSYVLGVLSTPAVREAEIEVHAAALEPGLPTVVAGDFNEGEGGRALRWLGWRGLHSALPRFSGRQNTWRWPTSLGTVEQQFDHVVVDGRLEPVEAQVLERGRSDHLPVVVELAPVALR